MTSLSSRGRENAAFEQPAGQFTEILSDSYDAEQNPSGVISLGSAENFLMHNELVEFLKANFEIDARACSYGDGAMGSTPLRSAMADHINRTFRPHTSVTMEQVMVSAGVTCVNEIFAWNLTDPGDGILLNMPIYGAFSTDLTQKTGSTLLYTPMDNVDPFSETVVEKYEKSLREAQDEGIKVRALLICNPHNPLGQCYPPTTIRRLMQFCDKHGLHLVADEVYALSVFDSGNPSALPFTSVLSLDTSGIIDPSYVHVLYGLSKDFAASGLRIGCIVSRNEELQRAVSSIARFHWPSGPSCAAATAMLSNLDWSASYISLAQDRLAQNYAVASSVLDDAGVTYHKGGNAGFFIWLNLSAHLPPSSSRDLTPIERERALAEKLLRNGVYLSTGEEFHSEEAGWFRLVFTHPEAKLREGLRR
ncbi:MAG: hypothetical protein M1833_001607 [Piccolia ochrophora]|nr:MAG: hypothetical protein M1833_001607 [Piccolia ochrophora]